MDYSEEAYQQLLKMRALGKKNYDEERYGKSLSDRRKAHEALYKATDAYCKDFTDENGKIVDDRRYDLLLAETQVSLFRDIIDGKRSDPNMTDTMYEMRGYKMMEEPDVTFGKWRLDFFGDEGYWIPGIPRRYGDNK